MLPLEILRLVKEALTMVPVIIKLLSETVTLLQKIDSAITCKESALKKQAEDKSKAAYTEYPPALRYSVQEEKQFMHTAGKHKLGFSRSDSNNDEMIETKNKYKAIKILWAKKVELICLKSLHSLNYLYSI